ncbi:MAG: hypothetical protein Tsb0020_25050 [Haliangiales bacterium]
MTSRVTSRVASPLAALVAVLSGCTSTPDATPAHADAGVLTAAETSPAQPSIAPTQRGYVAVVAARETTDLAALLSSQLTQVLVQLGDVVEDGQLLAKLDDRSIREELAAAVAAKRAAQAGLEQARVAVAEAARTLETERAMMSQGTTSRSDFEAAEFAHEKARAAERQAEADLSTQDARVAGLRTRLSQTRIVAPYAGTVSVRYLDPGTFVSSGTPVVRLIASGQLLVRFAVPSRDAKHIEIDAPMHVDIEPAGVTARALVRHIAPELDPASQMIIVEADLELDDADAPRIKAGQAARVYSPSAPAHQSRPTPGQDEASSLK